MVDPAAQNDLAVPLVAVQPFVFYFGLMADVTPPVGLAAYAAAAISGADPVKTGLPGFKYEIRTALLPFIFIFNNGLLTIDIQGSLDFILIIDTSALAVVAFVATKSAKLGSEKVQHEAGASDEVDEVVNEAQVYGSNRTDILSPQRTALS
jgi:TRAP-type uncharacterized transport system fused permease subunit